MRLMTATKKSAAFLFLGLIFFGISQDSSALALLKRILILFPHENQMLGFIQFESNLRSTLAGSKDYNFGFYIESMDMTRFPEEGVNKYVFDAHQLKRWGIKEENLPSGSEVCYKDFPLWETHRSGVIGVVSLLSIQTFLISALTVSRRKQRRVDLAFRKAADEWQTTFDSITDQIMLLDHRFRILRVNAAVLSFTGLSLDSILGRDCYSIMHENSVPPADCPCAKMLKSKAHEEGTLYDGKRNAWFLVTVDPILDHKKEITGVVHTVKDVTERRRAIEATRASEEFNRAVLASLSTHIAILDKQGTILAVNEAWERFARQNGAFSLAGLGCGVNYLEVCRRSIQRPSDCAGRALNGILSVLDGKKDIFSIEYPCDSPSESRWFFMKVMPFRSPEGGVVVSHTDITERKTAELEAQLRREELTHVTRIITIGELAMALSHEINQPITAILCNAEAARRFLSHPAPDMDELRNILDDIIRDDRRAGEVIERMRALVKKETPRREMVVLNDAVRETIALVRSASLLGEISWAAELAPELPAVQGDRVQLQQVLLNLLLNATTAMKNTPRTLRKLVIRTAMRDSRTVMVSVEDSGTGIDQDITDHLFEPFCTTKADGLGMGLAISQTIIKAHSGRIWAENNAERGATFHFTLPLNWEEQP